MRASEALPERFNAAAHFVDRNVAEGRGASAALSLRGPDPHLRRTCKRSTEPHRQRPARARRGGGRPRPDDLPRRARVPGDVLGRDQDRRGARARQHADAGRGLPARAQGQPGEGRRRRLRSSPRRPRARRRASPPARPRRGPPGSFLSLGSAREKASPTLEAADTSRDDPAFWLYSLRAPPGSPKGAVHLQHDMFVCAETYARRVLGIRSTDRVFSAAKLFFALRPRQRRLLSPLGRRAVRPPRTAPHARRGLRGDRPPPADAVLRRPTLYAGMLAIPDAGRRPDLSSLRLCVSAGEALPADLYARWLERFGVEIIDGMGPRSCCTCACRTGPAPSGPDRPAVPYRATTR